MRLEHDKEQRHSLKNGVAKLDASGPQAARTAAADEAIFFDEIPSCEWDNARALSMISGRALVLVHPHPDYYPPEMLERIIPLLRQNSSPVIALVELDRVGEARRALEAFDASCVVYVPTWCGYSEPMLNWRTCNQELLKDRDRLRSVVRACTKPRSNSPGGWELRSHEPTWECVDLSRSVLAAKLKDLGINAVLLAGAYYGIDAGGCAGRTELQLGQHLPVTPTAGLYPEDFVPPQALSIEESVEFLRGAE